MFALCKMLTRSVASAKKADGMAWCMVQLQNWTKWNDNKRNLTACDHNLAMVWSISKMLLSWNQTEQ